MQPFPAASFFCAPELESVSFQAEQVFNSLDPWAPYITLFLTPRSPSFCQAFTGRLRSVSAMVQAWAPSFPHIASLSVIPLRPQSLFGLGGKAEPGGRREQTEANSPPCLSMSPVGPAEGGGGQLDHRKLGSSDRALQCTPS